MEAESRRDKYGQSGRGVVRDRGGVQTQASDRSSVVEIIFT